MPRDVDRDPVVASFWQFDPNEDDPDVEAMVSALSIIRSEDGDDGRVLIAVRGKPRTRYEAKDSVWLELEDSEVIRLIGRLAGALMRKAAT